jgi:Hint domain
VTTRGEKPIKWIGRQHLGQSRSARWPDSVHPIRVSRSALADNVPHADLYLSPTHGLLIDDVLIEVKHIFVLGALWGSARALRKRRSA